MLCSGHFPSFAMLVIGAKRLKFTAELGASVMYGASILAALIALIMMLTGSFVQLTPTLVIVYNLIVMGVALLIQHIKIKPRSVVKQTEVIFYLLLIVQSIG